MCEQQMRIKGTCVPDMELRGSESDRGYMVRGPKTLTLNLQPQTVYLGPYGRFV